MRDRKRQSGRQRRGYAGGVVPLLDFASGAFVRASEASYHNGSTSSIAWAASGELRWEDRGDGAGAMALIEESRTNRQTYSEDLSQAQWTARSGTEASSATTTPDGDTDGHYITASGTLLAQGQLGDTGVHTGADYLSAFYKARVGSYATGWIGFGAYPSSSYVRIAQPSEWTRIEDIGDGVSHANWTIVGCDDGSASVLNDEVDVWGVQLEDGGAFSTSYIRTSGATGTRAADDLTIASADVSSDFYAGKWQCKIAPGWASSGAARTGYPFYLDASNRLTLFNSGGGELRMHIGGVNQGGVTCTWDKYTVLTVTVDFIAGELTVSGAVTGGGTVALSGGAGQSWPTADVEVGSDGASSGYFCGRISEPLPL